VIEEDTKKLKNYLTSEMVSRVTLAEAINIMHSLAVDEVIKNVDKMSDEEKQTALEELSARVEAGNKEKTEEKTEE
jgi:Mg/Co/Ni transporter MgtE